MSDVSDVDCNQYSGRAKRPRVTKFHQQGLALLRTDARPGLVSLGVSRVFGDPRMRDPHRCRSTYQDDSLDAFRASTITSFAPAGAYASGST
jgi:hypothetical protein